MAGTGGDIGAGIGGLIGGAAVLAGAGGAGGEKYYRRAVEIWKKLQDPEFDFRDLTAPELQIVAEYVPEVYDAYVPDEVKLAADSPEMRAAQARGLASLERYAREGIPAAERAAVQEAQDAVAREATRTRDSALSALGERGNLGGGDELQARLMGSQAASNLAGQAGRDLARERSLARLEATGAAAGLAGQIRGQDVSRNLANAQMNNRYNEMLAALVTSSRRDAAASRERAGFANTAEGQRVADTNAMQAYLTRLENLNRKNQLQSDLFAARATKAAGQAGALMNYGAAKDRSRAAREEAILSIGEGGGRATGGAAGSIFGF